MTAPPCLACATRGVDTPADFPAIHLCCDCLDAAACHLDVCAPCLATGLHVPRTYGPFCPRHFDEQSADWRRDFAESSGPDSLIP